MGGFFYSGNFACKTLLAPELKCIVSRRCLFALQGKKTKNKMVSLK